MGGEGRGGELGFLEESRGFQGNVGGGGVVSSRQERTIENCLPINRLIRESGRFDRDTAKIL